MNDYDFAIQDFVQGYPLQSWVFVVLRARKNETQKAAIDLGEKTTLEIHLKKL